ncbi:MAG: cytochrome c maturation protein CcmE [Alphaproteobacteria bacterium]|nr:cytochrome c maturation protein CcmE [Alphaproteobacteria bacterium]
MKRKHRRFLALLGSMTLLGLAAALILGAFEDNLLFFYTPTQLAEKGPPGARFRLGGLVEEGSVAKDANGLTVRFRVTDLTNVVPVVYTGVLPDLFREGQGVVVEGEIDGAGLFAAAAVLAKHDENYMPKDVAEALKASGEWRGEEAE